MCLLLSIGPNQGIDLGHITACLIWCLLALTSTVNTSVLSSVFFMADSSGQWKIDDRIVVKLVSPGGALPRIFELPPESQCLGLPEGG